MANEPMEDFVRRVVGRVPVPGGLEARIRASAARRRAARWGAWAAAGLAAAGLAIFWPRPRPVEPAVRGPVFSLQEPVPAPVDVRGVELSTEVRAQEGGLAFRFLKGGPTDE